MSKLPDEDLGQRLLRLLVEARDLDDGAARVELNRLLRRDAAARRVWARLLVDEQALVDGLRTQGIVSQLRASPAPAPWRPGFRRWPMTVGLALGMLCATLVFAFLLTGIKPAPSVRLPLVDGGFEQARPLSSQGVPTDYGLWSGDYAAVVGAEQGVLPHGGQRMLRFLRSDSSLAGSHVGPPNSNLFQIVDLRPYRAVLASGRARAAWSAWFNAVRIPESAGMRFAAGLWAFSGDPAMLAENWSRHLYLETAKSSRVLPFNPSEPGWLKLEGAMILPPEADFLVVELKAMPAPGLPEDRPYLFPGAYADDIELTLGDGAERPLISILRSAPMPTPR